MRYSYVKLVILSLLVTLLYNCKPNEQTYTQYVNPFIGTGGHGHTYPGATLPFGMVQLSPDSRLEGWDGCSGYHYTDSVIYGFSHTHLSGTGVSDYGDILLMPIQGEIEFDNGAKNNGNTGYASSFLKKNENARPGYYEVLLDKHDIRVRLTSTVRVGIHEYTFNQEGPSHLILDLTHRDRLIGDSIAILNNKEVVGSRISKAWAAEQHIYFIMQFSKAFDRHTVDSSGKKMAFTFDTKANEKLLVKVGISSVDIEGARKNLETEAAHWEFKAYLNDASFVWEKALSKIQIEDHNEDKKTTFYTALYHSMIAPNTFSDVDGKYRGMDHNVHQSKKTIYTVFSLWDTFRATHPLFSIIEQEKTNEFINTFLKQYQDGGKLPIWELAGNYTGCMIGYHSIPVITDAYVKGIHDYDAELALKAMQYSAQQDELGLAAYKSKGYIGMADESESVSKTLEYAYDDWCIAQMAQSMGKEAIYQTYISRAQYFKNIFNPEVGFMQGKMNGAWSIGFDPSEVNFNFTEANSWQYSMFAPQDITGLIQLYGGNDSFETKLDQLFSTEMKLTGRHQADITGLIGQYAHGNEPSHHMAYLYNYVGKPFKTQKRVNQILNEQYNNAPNGLSGNEDCGQMSSWYVLSSIGFYSVTPGLNYYAVGAPQFDKVSIQLENGKTFTIKTKKESNQSFYIQKTNLNGKDLNRSYLMHEEIMEGGVLVFELGDQPNKSWAVGGSPTAKINEEDQIVPVPYFSTTSQTFTDSLLIEIKGIGISDSIFYSFNQEDYLPYTDPFYINKAEEISIYAKNSGKKSLIVKNAQFKKIKGGRSIDLKSNYSNQYSAGGKDGLINYLRGGNNFRTGYWQGFYDIDFSAIVSLEEEETIHKVSIGALQDIQSWIWYPQSVTFSISSDGESFQPLKTLKNDFSDQEYGSFTHEFELSLSQSVKAKYVKVEAKNYGPCPKWHLGNGNPSWLFFDEITIE